MAYFVAVKQIKAQEAIATSLKQIESTQKQIESEQEQKLLLWTIMREWNSKEILSCRQNAGKLIRENPSKSLKELHDDFDVDYTSIAVVMGFLTNLNMCIDQNILPVEKVSKEFGQDFNWWHEVAVKDKYPVEWGGLDEWNKLRKRIKDSAGNDPAGNDLFEVWQNRGIAILDDYKKSAKQMLLTSGLAEEKITSNENSNVQS